MKKIINRPQDVTNELFEGFLLAYGDKYKYKRVAGVRGFTVAGKKEKTALLVGGGSGHEPLFTGLAGGGMADAIAAGDIFASPDPNTILEVTKAANMGKGVLYVYGNYAGDNLNFRMAAELAELQGIDVKIVTVSDDVSSAPFDRREERRGIAGDIFVVKIAGAATENGYDLERAHNVTRKAAENTRSIGIALSPGSIPGQDFTFTIGDDEVEYGMGLHGEPGVSRQKIQAADVMVNKMMEDLLADFRLIPGDEVCVLVNGLGSTTLMELLIMYRTVNKILLENEIAIHDVDVNSYCTTQEMAGASITLFKLDGELGKLYDFPADAPYYKKFQGFCGRR